MINNTRRVQQPLYFFEMLLTRVTQIFQHLGRMRREFFTGFFLAVQHTHRILFEPRFAIEAHFGKMRRKIFSQRRLITGAATFASDGIDSKRYVFQSQIF